MLLLLMIQVDGAKSDLNQSNFLMTDQLSRSALNFRWLMHFDFSMPCDDPHSPW